MEQPFTHSGTRDPAPSPREQENAALARQAAAAGIVLLKNRGVLPLNPGAPVALFGAGAGRTVKGGTGSGDVNNRASVSIWQDLKGAKAALYVISRIAGEGKDRRLEPGDYYLSDAERADLQTLDESGLPVVLLLNAGGPVELTGLLDGMQHLDAILQLSQLGQQGGQAVADVLLGRAVPEGKLTATWARRYDDIPCARAFGSLKGDVSQDTYRDGVYVGYRYFDSFGVRPLFAFGFGLSYTTFALRAAGLDVQPGHLAVQVEVANTGARFAGREVAQVYLSAPQGELPRERRRLAGFAKTRRLAPGETQTLTLEIPQKQLAAFHPEQNAWVVDAGLYGVWVGNSSDALRLCAMLEVDAAVTLERTHPICPPQHPIGELGAAPGAQDREADQWRQKVEYDLPVYKFVPVAPAAPAPAAPLLAEGDLDSLVPLLYGNITAGASTLGSAGIRVPGSAGETSEALEASRQIPSLIMADGPAGLRLRQCYQADRATGEVYGAGVLGSLENGFLEAPPRHESADTYYQFCTAFPVGTALAQSWDPDLLAQVGRAVSREMDEFHVDLWLAPGMNIQRNPLCGRNFEYYSEDPLLTGTLAAAITAGVQESGRHGVTLKHFACNNQEDNRMAVDARVSKRALREIYLRGFEIAVKAAAPAAVMSAYNCINGVHAANSRDLCTVVLRQEWGFAGLVMSDWNTTVPQDGSTPWRCAWAGNDVIMPGNPHDDADIRAALADGRLPETAAPFRFQPHRQMRAFLCCLQRWRCESIPNRTQTGQNRQIKLTKPPVLFTVYYSISNRQFAFAAPRTAAIPIVESEETIHEHAPSRFYRNPAGPAARTRRHPA